MIEIEKDIFYVGVNDRHKAKFEGLWPLPHGVSYNSYLINDDKVCLIDTVEVDFFVQFMERVQEVIGDKPIDYVVVNHMEPDHSGGLALLRKFYPNVKVVGNKKTFDMLKGYYDISDGTHEVKDGDELNLGQHTLTFYMTPMVHWPETMMTLDTKTHALFSGDAFGSFGALNGGIIDKDIDTSWCKAEMIRYYSNIVGKYGTPVQNALKKLAGVQIDYICSTHGPVWHRMAAEVVHLYDRMSKYETDPGLVICYGTMYGNTERMAEEIAIAASEAGIRNIRLYNVSTRHHSFILRDIFKYKGLIVGAPTYNNGLYHEMDVLLTEIAGRDIKNHLIGWFGSFSWAGKAVKCIQEANEKSIHFTPVGEPVEMKQGFSNAVKEKCRALGRAMAEALLADENKD